MVTWVHVTSPTEQSWLNQTDHGFIRYDRLSQPKVRLLRDRFVFVSLRVLKAVFVFFSRARAESKVQKTDARQTTRHRTKS